MMKLTNRQDRGDGTPSPAMRRLCLRAVALQLFPMAPHAAAELWERLCRAEALSVQRGEEGWEQCYGASSAEAAALRCSTEWAGDPMQADIMQQVIPVLLKLASVMRIVLRANGALEEEAEPADLMHQN